MNDKNKADFGKAPISLVPTRIIWEIAKVRDYGVNVKYPETGRDGWRDIDIERIRDAMLRHCLRYIEDPKGVDHTWQQTWPSYVRWILMGENNE